MILLTELVPNWFEGTAHLIAVEIASTQNLPLHIVQVEKVKNAFRWAPPSIQSHRLHQQKSIIWSNFPFMCVSIKTKNPKNNKKENK